MSDRTKTLVVIGGSRGIGAATACLGAKAGYSVAIGYRNRRDQAVSIVSGIQAEGGKAQAFQIDVRSVESVEYFFDQVVELFSIFCAVANCAGISGRVSGFMDLSPALLNEVFATNLTGTFYCVQAAARRMAQSRGGCGGSIVNLSSEAARFGGNRISPYAASKAGVAAMTIGVARELADEGIRLNAVSPGVIDTDQQEGITVEHRRALISGIPLGRMGQADEVAKVILWLLSSEASYMTGSVVTVSGGR